MAKAPGWYSELIRKCPPQHHTEPNWGCPHTMKKYHEYCVIADLAGFYPLPWQRLKWALLSDPEVYETIVIVGRQQGKTTSDIPVLAHPMLSQPRHSVVYSAQRGVDAERKVREEFLPALRQAGMNESTGFTFNNGATNWGLHGINETHLRVMSSSKEALRGTTRVALGILDEARTERDSNKLVLLVPTMTVVRDAKLVVESTAGDIDSVFLRDRVNLALEQSSSASTLIWGFDSVEDVDIESPDVWRSVLPAIGYTVTIEAIRRAFDTMEPHNFAMEYLGIWLEASMDQAIPQDIWNHITTPNVSLQGDIVVCFDAPPEQDLTAAVACDEYGNVELIGVREGPDPVYKWAIQLLDRNPDIREVAMADSTTLRRAGERLSLAGHYVRWYDTKMMQQAAARFWEACHSDPREVAIRENEVMTAANKGAFRWIMGGDKAWVFRRQEEVNFASPLIAATIAYDAAVKPLENVVGEGSSMWHEVDAIISGG